MNVAKKELCEELYDLSGWDDAPLMYCTTNEPGSSQTGTHLMTRLGVDMSLVEDEPHYVVYDLGYLMRKFQDNDLTILLRCNRDMGGRSGMSSWDSRWCIGTFDMPQGSYPVADTAEDAAVMLAINLFKRGILTRDGETNA